MVQLYAYIVEMLEDAIDSVCCVKTLTQNSHRWNTTPLG